MAERAAYEEQVRREDEEGRGGADEEDEGLQVFDEDADAQMDVDGTPAAVPRKRQRPAVDHFAGTSVFALGGFIGSLFASCFYRLWGSTVNRGRIQTRLPIRRGISSIVNTAAKEKEDHEGFCSQHQEEGQEEGNRELTDPDNCPAVQAHAIQRNGEW